VRAGRQKHAERGKRMTWGPVAPKGGGRGKKGGKGDRRKKWVRGEKGDKLNLRWREEQPSDMTENKPGKQRN